MTTETLTVAPSHYEWLKIFNEQVFQAQTGAVQVQARTGSRWNLILTYMNITSTRREVAEGHAAQLQGMRNRLQVPMSLLAYTRGGTGGGTPLLVGAHSAGATQLAIDGASATITNWLRPTDRIRIGNELKEVTKAVNTNGSGVATIDIWPELHHNFADNTAVDITAPFGVFMLAAPYALDRTRLRAGIVNSSLSLSLIEDVLA